ncbi:MAG: hypothetical protein AVDCRST_MAG12-2547 [uncultured Rubrobacteraceae bacterium]|uniref:Uncharacterized protein n=1 Tax=uncultured Rubrobacteraceae bacterium TaxID=349277 RepID=A0A6J4SHS8_9ACTN|nr:MAG: hypothetical protein AVDCRST_MAG12-2547 [uncultured Rubrobacteraceae bacterium]
MRAAFGFPSIRGLSRAYFFSNLGLLQETSPRCVGRKGRQT